ARNWKKRGNFYLRFMADKRPVHIFIAYARQDKAIFEHLFAQLSPLNRRADVDIWYDRELDGGDKWKAEIENQLRKADLILLLVTPKFLFSDFVWEIEVPIAEEQVKAKKAKMIPVIAQECLWKDTVLGDYQALPTDGVPIQSPKWTTPQAPYFEIAKAVKAEIEKLQAPPKSKPKPKPKSKPKPKPESREKPAPEKPATSTTSSTSETPKPKPEPKPKPPEPAPASTTASSSYTPSRGSGLFDELWKQISAFLGGAALITWLLYNLGWFPFNPGGPFFGPGASDGSAVMPIDSFGGAQPPDTVFAIPPGSSPVDTKLDPTTLELLEKPVMSPNPCGMKCTLTNYDLSQVLSASLHKRIPAITRKPNQWMQGIELKRYSVMELRNALDLRAYSNGKYRLVLNLKSGKNRNVDFSISN
ncbi:MAG: toll/interleukin-1 receptor domain-containing protein, partial [Bacteroidota bacterium]